MAEDKKIKRKLSRFAAQLKSSKGIICAEVPGPNIIVCNAGQATGLESDHVYKIIKDSNLNISTPKYVAIKGETYSFLIFKNTEEAKLFYKSCNARCFMDKNDTPLFFHYVENVPSTEVVCPYKNPEGLNLLQNFISEEEEEELISIFDWQDTESNALRNRQVKHFGYEFRYGSNDVDLNNPLEEKIPKVCEILWQRLTEHGYDVGVPDQLTVNKYLPGQGIPSHVDKHSPFGDTILSLSLGSSVVMDWKHHSGKYVPVLVEPRCLLIMQGEARYDWQHGIQPRTYDPILEDRLISNELVRVITNETKPRTTRISLTFRWTRSGPCECNYKTLCDSAKKDITDDVASNLEELHVHQVYEQIASHFSTTRHKPWPRVVEFMEQVPAGAIVLDLGCGNGKNILRRNDILQIAGERSSGLLAECKEHTRHTAGADCVRLDLLSAALRDRCADAVICIAVIHHFSSRIRRLQAVSTIARLLRPGGRALITVWAKDQAKSNYLLKNKTQPSENEIMSVGGVNLPVHENRTQFKHNDLLVPWKLRLKSNDKLQSQPENTLFRYYHVFEDGELENLCKEIPNLAIDNSFFDEGNWCVVIKKIQ